MAVAAGGSIKQVIHKDNNGERWLVDRTTVFNIQILNSAVYKKVTGLAPPTVPLDVATYKKQGLPFFKIYEEPSGISGDFSQVKSVARVCDSVEEIVTPDTIDITEQRKDGEVSSTAAKKTKKTSHPVGLVNLKNEYKGSHIVKF